MERKYLINLLIVLVGSFFICTNAMALPHLTISDGSCTVDIQDNSDDDFYNSEDGLIGFFGTVGGWDATMSFGSSYPATGTIGFPEMHLSGSTLALTGSGTLTFTFEDTFSSWDDNLEGLVSAFGGEGPGSVSFSTYLDGMLLAEFGPMKGSFSESMESLIVPEDLSNFTLTIMGTITNSNGDHTSFDGGIAPVPEPSTILLLGTGLIGLAGASRKKLFKK
jgi:hypothetical protein